MGLTGKFFTLNICRTGVCLIVLQAFGLLLFGNRRNEEMEMADGNNDTMRGLYAAQTISRKREGRTGEHYI